MQLKHLAIIPDGNRRLARRLLEQPWKGHEWGVQKLYTLLDWCKEFGVQTVTFYALSLENLQKRPQGELEFLFHLARKELRDILSDPQHRVHRNRIRVQFFGKLSVLPQDLQRSMRQVAAKTRAYQGRTLNLAMAYGGRQEIVDAANRLKGKVTERSFRKALWTNGCGDPDLILRTGGERRLSNFLIFQSAYTELAFVDTFWPEFSKKEFRQAMQDYQARERRFGK